MKNIEFDREEIEGIFHSAESSLFSESSIHWLNYDLPFTCMNISEVIDQVKNLPIVYCIWISDGLEPRPIYVEHSSASLSRQRLFNHFVDKHVKTGAKLEKVKEALLNGKRIGISFLRIEPDYMRKPLEEWLISRNSDKLVWNIHGKLKRR
ncbi:hypothetical protein [Shivajiella indica]|uniref:GIY-YIG nuclease family protein n=1 Tax=Shivajiella indica TaxID=872115 RepID=A0ABW5B3N6_9BACT